MGFEKNLYFPLQILNLSFVSNLSRCISKLTSGQLFHPASIIEMSIFTDKNKALLRWLFQKKHNIMIQNVWKNR